MFVIQEPTKTSSIFFGRLSSAKISLKVATSSGSFGQARIGSLILLRLISIMYAYFASLSALKRVGFLSHSLILSALLARVALSSYPASIIASISEIFDLIYSLTLSMLKSTLQAAADLSALASLSSKACSTFKFGKPSISKIFPAKMFFLFFFSTVSCPCLIA